MSKTATKPAPPLAGTPPQVSAKPDPPFAGSQYHAAVEVLLDALKIETQARLAAIPGRLQAMIARANRGDPDKRDQRELNAINWASREEAAILRRIADAEERAATLEQRRADRIAADEAPPAVGEETPLTRFASDMFAKARRLRTRADLLKGKGKPRQVSTLLAQARQAELAGAKSQQDKLDLVWADAAIDETVALAALRGDEVAVPTRLGAGRKPARRVTGIDWLLSKGRIDCYQHQAAERYELDFAAADAIGLPSCLREGGGGGQSDAAQSRRVQAQSRLDKAREKGLKNHQGMIDLCDQVCGQGLRLRQVSQGDEKQSLRNEAILLVALDLLVEHYGIL